MPDVYTVLMGGVTGMLGKYATDREQQEKVVTDLMEWLAGAKKRPVPDIEKRMEDMRKRVEHLSENLTVEIVRGKLVVRTAGSDSDTLKMFQFGTSWFEPHPDVTAQIVNALITDKIE